MNIAKEEFIVKTVSAVEKVFPYSSPKALETSGMCLKNSRYNFQLAITGKARKGFCKIKIESILEEFITVREVKNVPVELPFTEYCDDDTFVHSKKAGLYPDLLVPLTTEIGYPILVGQWKSLFITVSQKKDKTLPVGIHPIVISVLDINDVLLGKIEYTLEVLDVSLPPLPVFNINWIHYDCISNYYNLPVFSEAFNEIFDKYVENLIQHGGNSILVPLFTPPLDTAVGKERKTVQLVGVNVRNGKYEFNLEPLRFFIRRMRAIGITYFEFSHLFTQWGGTACPKIIANVDGEEKRIFGWDTPSDGKAYTDFLKALLPQIVALTKEEYVKDRCFWHITDEPNEKKDLALYSKLKTLVQELVDGMDIIDAMSDYAFYEKKLVTIPVVCTDQFKNFQGKCDKFAIYYCCGTAKNLSNRYLCMTGVRTRILGLQAYLHNVAGFLHWGYNFWNTQLSKSLLNPWLSTDALGAYPAGDCFIVYPGNDRPWDSIRNEIISDGWQDYRIALLAERYIGRERVEKILTSFGMKDLDIYPHSPKKYLRMREALLSIIREHC